ncbi:Tyrosine-protein kinase Fps85D [Strongyloides ratti]|uniref:Tyrosine-protein kinase n=1 Tax=Strongyloides ratti TaxID=34506 RepID=A0A090MY77_STRRB|nr:Tyrosine-protein kinase Fps85D [Strongyloides ratti]CEF66704.1 Tyrosine-protein kinase Fps85D [Strongyloides ratti]
MEQSKKNVESKKKDLILSKNHLISKLDRLANSSVNSVYSKNLLVGRKSKKTRMFFSNKKDNGHIECDIEEQTYFHGLLPRKYIGSNFKNPGDYLILLKYRGTEPRYFLELLDGDILVKRIEIVKENGYYYLSISGDNLKSFSSIPSLVKYYHRNQIPGYICLKNPIQRPKTFYCHSYVKYNKNDDLIGKGSFSTIYKGIINEGPHKGTPTIIKFLDHGKKETDKEYFKTIKKTYKYLIKEASILFETNDKNILTFYGICIDNLPIALLIEYCPEGTLESHLKKEKNNICIGELLYYCYDIVKGMKHLSMLKIVHKNLTPSSIFISNNGYLKIGSFSKASEYGCNDTMPTEIELRYQPPEYMLNKNIELNESTDIWSYGITVFQIFNNGLLPLQEINDEQFKERILQNNFFSFPKKCPDTLSFGMKKGIFISQPTNRFTFCNIEELLEVILKRTDLYPLPKPNETSLSKKGISRSFILL